MDIAAWLRSLGLERYAPAFHDHEIDAAVLPELTDEHLKELGLPLGPRLKLLKAIAALRADPPSAGEPAALPSEAKPGPLTGAAAPEAERRQLTVMFVDLVGSTALSGRLDPEDMGAVIRAYQDACANVITRFEGHIAKYLGDGVLAYFGYPQAHEDAAERAVRAGLGVIEAVARLAAPDGTPLAARVGIATGLVVVGELIGRGEAQERAVVGETPNLAARLQAVAEPNAVVIGPTTRRLIGSLFEDADLGARDLKGFAAPVRAWRVLGPSAAHGRFDARQAAGLTPLVGREAELALLLGRWEQAKDGQGQVVLLSGEPGIGKSRVVREMRERLAGEPHRRLSYQCSPYHPTSPLHPVIEQLERAAGLVRDELPGQQLDKLERLLVRGTGQLDETVPLLAALLAVPTGGRYPPLDLTPQRQKQRTLDVLVDQLAGLAAEQPVLVVYEDVHWVDPTTLELLDLTIERVRRLPVLLLMTFRPEFKPPWTGLPHVSALALTRLGRRQGAALVKRMTGGKALPAEVAEQIAAKTDGVPLFVEELTKAVLESGLLRDEGDRYALAGPLPPLAIPATLQDSLLARLDRLAPVKEVAQVGAAIGREFAYELLAAVAPLPDDRLREALDQLVGAELVFRRGTPPEASYSFKHALVQDAAYGTLLKSKRRQIHAHIAAALEERFPEAAELQPELLARHCTEAGLADKAIEYWYRAGRRAMAQSAMAEAVAQLTQALELLAGLPAGPDRDRRELDLQIALGGALIAAKGWSSSEVGRTYERARELCTKEARLPQLLAALSGLYAHHLHWSGARVALGIAEELLRLAERQGDTAAQAAGHRFVATGLMFNGRLLTALPHFERALALYDPADRSSPVHLWGPDTRVACLSFTALILLWQGYPDRAVVRGREALAAAHELGHPYTTSQALFLNGWLHQIRGESRVVRGRSGTMMSLTAEHGFAAWLTDATILHGWALAAAGEVTVGLAQMRHGLAACQASGVLLFQPSYLGLLADLSIRAGNPTEALALLDEAEAIVDRAEVRWFEAELHRLQGEALLGTGRADSDEAEACFARAIESARAQSAKWWELRAVTALARLWVDQGERRKARDLLAPVYAWFTEGFDSQDLRNARTLLDELG
jgi:class 3 adenylate cyclase/predicted ATPase